jgi:uncharacterized protein YciI
MSTSRLSLVLFASFALFLATAAPFARSQDAPKQYIYVLHPAARLQQGGAWTDSDNAAVSAHFARLQEATASGKVILAGKTDEPDSVTFGIVIFEAADTAAAEAFMAEDPAVVAGVMTAELHPYTVALLRK